MKPIERILVATDFSPCSDAAVECAARLARQLDAVVRVVHVIDTSGIMDGYGDTPFRAQRLREVREEAEQRLARLAAGRFAEVEDVQVHVADNADVCAGILTAAERLGADLILIGTHGKTGLAHLILGSVAERVVRASAIPVMSVRQPVA